MKKATHKSECVLSAILCHHLCFPLCLTFFHLFLLTFLNSKAILQKEMRLEDESH